MKVLNLICLVCILATACTGNGSSRQGLRQDPDHPTTRYATRFSVEDFGSFRMLRVFDPWQNSRETTFTYILGSQSRAVPDSLKQYPFIQIPVQRVITMSTTHVAMISQLGREWTIRGASGTGFIFNSEITRQVDAGRVQEVGHDQGLNYEVIIDLDPDVLFLFGVESSVRNTSEKLLEMGIKVVYCADYLERHPLGKAEWIRFFAQFYDMEGEADKFFNRIDSGYQVLKAQTEGLGEKPLVLTGLPWKDTWYMAGGKSFASRLIGDAGGKYLWKDHPSPEAVPLDLESVFARAVTADIWINPGVANSLQELAGHDARFLHLPVVESGMVYNNNARMSSGGGNDYWESGTVRPDLVLADLISCISS